MIDAKKLERNVAFNRVYDMCQQRIISCAKKDMLRTVFEMPEFILGIPPFNLNDALTHVIDRLKNNGFLVMYFFPKLLYISWDLDEINGKKRVQPVALLPGNGKQVPLKIAAQAAPSAADAADATHSAGSMQMCQTSSTTKLLPPPQQTRQYSGISSPTTPYLPPRMPPLDLPMPVASRKLVQKPQSNSNAQQNAPQNKQTMEPSRFFKSISDYKPSGKFVLDLN